MNKMWGLRAAIVLTAAILLFFMFYPIYKDSLDKDNEYVIYESLQCVSTVCVIDSKVGKECRIIDNKMSKIQISVDNDNPKQKRITIRPVNVHCSR